MDRAVFGDEPLIVFIAIYCFLGLNFEFYLLQRYFTKVVPLCVIWAPSYKYAKQCGQPSGKCDIGCQRLLATSDKSLR
jgi:hypothetical protein